MNQKETNHENIYRNNQTIDHEKHQAQVQNITEEPVNVKKRKRKHRAKKLSMT